ILKQAYQDEFLADEAANLLGQAHEALGNRSEAARMHIVASMRPYAGVQVQEDSKAALKRMNVTMEEIRVWDKEWRQAARPLAKQPQKKDPFTASIQVGVEAGDNIPAIADELAPFVPRRADTGKFWNVDLGYNFRDDKHQRIDLDVGYSGNDYHHLNQFETDSINALLAWRVHGKNHQWRFVPSIGRMELGDRDYLHNWGMEVGYVHRQATGRWLDANVRGRWNDFQIAPRLAREDRDGRDTRLSISQNWRETTRSGLSSTYGIGLFAARADTDGADYDTDKRGLRLFLRRDLNRKLTFYGSYTYEDRDHDNASVRSVTGQSRHDKDHQTFMRLDHRFDKKQSVFATYQDSLNDSNLGTSFGFRARTWSLGYSHDF
ncbi:MAG TPA: hypothetical protein PKO06_08065, partial [Candidatus Ozemobacteraceae bacterium]|nr:hypothetical protein [Candidatus Ozemobacteraceae bacterium]